MSKECTCTEEMQQMAMKHVAGCEECRRDEDGDIEPCSDLFNLLHDFEVNRSIAIWPDGKFQHYDVPPPSEETL